MTHVVRSWNAHVLMPGALVAAVIRRHRDVDIWFLQESHRRRKTLSRIPGYTLYMPLGLPGQSKQDRVAAGGNPILVRSTLDQQPLPPVRLRKRWRRRRMPGIHPPRTLTRVWVEGIEYVNGHAPERFGPAIPARVEFMGAIRELFADGDPRVLGGDMNGKSRERGAGLPADVIADHDLAVGNSRPPRIDFFMGQGVTFAGTKAAPTREGSDHHAVQTSVTLVGAPTDPEPPMERQAFSLDVYVREITEAAPNRSRLSDGGRGDKAHSNRPSDHNPNSAGVWRAYDITHDPGDGVDCNEIAARLVELMREGHPALRSGAYIIWRRRILSFDRLREGWRRYSGSNPHDKHIHLSVSTAASGYDSRQPWGVMEEVVTEEDKREIADMAAAAVIKALSATTINPPGPEDDVRLFEVWGRTLNLAATIDGRLQENGGFPRKKVERVLHDANAPEEKK